MKNQKQIWRKILRSLVVTRSAEFPVVALCFLAATMFWFLNALNKEYTTRISYPIDFQYDKENLVSTQPLPSKITINVTGYGWTLLRKTLGIDAKPIVYQFENPLKTAFLTGASLLPSVTEQLKEAHINYVEDDTITVGFDTKAVKKVALQVDSTQIELRENYFLTSRVRLVPDTIDFEGPAKLIKKLPDVLIINVPGKDIDDNFEDEIPINYTQDPLIRLSSAVTSINFEVGEFVPQRVEVPVNALRISATKTLKLPIRNAEIEYWVAPENTGRVSAADFEVVADLSEWNKKDSTLALVLTKKPELARNVILRTQAVKLVK